MESLNLLSGHCSCGRITARGGASDCAYGQFLDIKGLNHHFTKILTYSHILLWSYITVYYPGMIAEGNKNINLSNTSTITVFFRSVEEKIPRASKNHPNISSHRCTVRDQESKINSEQLSEITQQQKLSDSGFKRRTNIIQVYLWRLDTELTVVFSGAESKPQY